MTAYLSDPAKQLTEVRASLSLSCFAIFSFWCIVWYIVENEEIQTLDCHAVLGHHSPNLSTTSSSFLRLASSRVLCPFPLFHPLPARASPHPSPPPRFLSQKPMSGRACTRRRSARVRRLATASTPRPRPCPCPCSPTTARAPSPAAGSASWVPALPTPSWCPGPRASPSVPPREARPPQRPPPTTAGRPASRWVGESGVFLVETRQL